MKKIPALSLLFFLLFSLSLLVYFLKPSQNFQPVLAQTCQGGDDVCPEGCTPENDNDCPKTPPGPTWINDLIIYWLRIDTFAPDQPGKSPIRAATEKLDYLADLGITAILLNPVAEISHEGDPKFYNFYGVREPGKPSSLLGTDQEFKSFVQRAHELGIKVILDVVDHGVTFDSSLIEGHPEWFQHDENGNIIGTWGMADFDWSVQEVRDWWVDLMVHTWAIPFDLDGFRCDLEPAITGYDIWNRVREVATARGKELVIISELRNERKGAYHMSQLDYGTRHPYGPEYDFFEDIVSIVDVLPSLDEPYYIFQLSSHDYKGYTALGRPVYFGYPMLLSPFVPLWRMGEEFNAPNLAPTDSIPTPVFDIPEGETSQSRPIKPGESRAQNFILPSNCEGLRVKAWAGSNDPNNQLRITLYRSVDSDYQKTIVRRPLFQKTFTGFKDGDWLKLLLEPTPATEHCLFVVDNIQGDIGVWAVKSDYGGTSFYNGQANGQEDILTELDKEQYGSVLYFSPLDWSAFDQPENRAFFEKVKKMIKIRKQYAQIIHPPVSRMEDRNLVAVSASGTDLPAYASYNAGQAIVVVGKNRAESGPVTINVPLEAMKMASFSHFKLTSLLEEDSSPREITAVDLQNYTFNLGKGDVVAFLIEGLGNLAEGKSGTASSGSSSLPYLTDDNEYTHWNSGGPAPAWFQLDLQLPTKVRKIRLQVEQLPDGYTKHQLYLGDSPDNLTLVHAFSQETKDGQWLEYQPTQPIEKIRYVKVSTTTSPSWVAWGEIQVLGEATVTIENLRDLLLQYNQSGCWDLNSDGIVNGLDFGRLRKLVD